MDTVQILRKKIQKNEEQREFLLKKIGNLEYEINNLEHKIENQRRVLQNLLKEK